MKQLKYILISLLFIAVFSGCKKFVEVDPPVTQLVTASVFNNDDAATAALLSIYAQMYNVPADLHRFTALSSDELFIYTSDPTLKNLYANSLNAITDGGAGQFWSRGYKYIYQANAVLEGLNGKGVSGTVKKQLSGEAQFIRAYLYFYLTNLYGDVPLVVTTDYITNSKLSRTPQAEVYKQIISDLNLAQNLLNADFVDASDTMITTDRVRPTSWAAKALLARTHLYLKNYDSAGLYAGSVIDHSSQFSLPADLSEVFLANSTEAIWQLLPASTDNYTPDGGYFILNTAPTPLKNSMTISTQLLNAFEPGDERRAQWIQPFTDGTNSWLFPYKYRSNNTATILTEYTMVFRLAEQYLIRAEANAQLDNLAEALADLNAIRHRAGLADYAGSTDKTSLLAAITHERQVELFTEADRWLDLKRTGEIDNVMSDVTPQKGSTWQSYQQLYPISITDIRNDINLTQTPGY